MDSSSSLSPDSLPLSPPESAESAALEYIVGSPADTFKPWDSTNADDAVPHLYRQVAEATGVKILADLRSHSWRSTLHAVFSDTIPLSRRAEMFGHTEAVAKDAYHDRANVDALLRDVDDAFIA